MDLPPSAYHLQSLNQMLELSETNACLHNLHSVRELDADRDFLADVGHTVSGILEGILDRIMHLALFTHLLRLSLDRLIFFRATSDRDGVNFLMRLAVPFVESGIVHSMLRAELLYWDILRKALSLVQKPKALKIFTAVYHSSHSLNDRKGIIFPIHTQDVKIDSLPVREPM